VSYGKVRRFRAVNAAHLGVDGGCMRLSMSFARGLIPAREGRKKLLLYIKGCGRVVEVGLGLDLLGSQIPCRFVDGVR
jgi:hypothetical protein